jgi:hypothetical protein
MRRKGYSSHGGRNVEAPHIGLVGLFGKCRDGRKMGNRLSTTGEENALTGEPQERWEMK